MHDNCDDPDILNEVEQCITRARLEVATPTQSGQAASSGSEPDEDTDQSDPDDTSVACGGPLASEERIYMVDYLKAYRQLL